MGQSEGEAPEFELPAVQILSLAELSNGKAAIAVVFFDQRGAEFCRKRLQAFQAILPILVSRSVNVVGLSVDNDLDATGEWAKQIGVTFPLLADHDGSVCKGFGVLSGNGKASERALVVVKGRQIIYRRIVTDTEVPQDFFHALS